MSIETVIVTVVIALAVAVAGWKLYRVLSRKESPCGSCNEHGACPFETGSRSCSVESPHQCPKKPDSDEKNPSTSSGSGKGDAE